MNALIVLAYSTLYHKLKMLLQKVLNPRKTEKKHKHSLIWKESIIQITSQNNMKTLGGGSLNHRVDLYMFFQVTINI